MSRCARCLYSGTHPLLISFDVAGVCSGCRVHEEKERLDWSERLERLRKLVDPFRSRARGIHDCVIPVSGARDSFFIVHVVKNVLGLHPLLVTYNKHYQTKVGIRNLSLLRTLLGADLITQTVSPETVKRITRESLAQKGSIYWHCLAGSTAFPVQTAVRFRIPLVIWGAHQGLDQVGMFSHLDEVEMTRRYRKEHDLMGLEAQDLAAQAQLVTDEDVEPYRYPSDRELAAVGVRGIYLGNYLRWDSKAQHEAMLERYSYGTRAQLRTFDTYNDVDCFHYSGLHDAIKYRKHGYGKVTDHASREIRLGRLTREQGLELVARYEPVEPTDTRVFLDWLGMPSDELWGLVDAHRDPRVWNRVDDGWVRSREAFNPPRADAVDAARLKTEGLCVFKETAPDVGDDTGGYTLVGRGWNDTSLSQ